MTIDNLITKLKKQPFSGSYQMLPALLGDVTDRHLAELSMIAKRVRERHFGRIVNLFAPIYLSNKCQNICTYCGFSVANKIPRKVLDDEEIRREAEIVASKGFKSVLLVTGESREVSIPFLLNAVKIMREYFEQISIEVQPLAEEGYRELQQAGVYAVIVYQETYDRDRYKIFHPKGMKSKYDFRLDTPERIGRANLHKIGLGVLLGLSDWRSDCLALGEHLARLRRMYWQTRFSVSFPRLRPIAGQMDDQVLEVTERDLIQVLLAFRIVDPTLEIVLSTRESIAFRDMALDLGVTTYSAESETEPGGYYNTLADSTARNLEQFEISDERSIKEVAKMIACRGFDAVTKDWSLNYSQ